MTVLDSKSAIFLCPALTCLICVLPSPLTCLICVLPSPLTCLICVLPSPVLFVPCPHLSYLCPPLLFHTLSQSYCSMTSSACFVPCHNPFPCPTNYMPSPFIPPSPLFISIFTFLWWRQFSFIALDNRLVISRYILFIYPQGIHYTSN